MYDPSRLRGVLVAAAVVALAMAGLSAVSIATVGGRPAFLSRGDSTIEGGQEKIVGGRVAGAAAWGRSRGTGSLDDLGVILGASAVGMGIAPPELEAAHGPGMPARWLSLYANGANAADIRDLGGYLIGGDLRPKLLVLGIHPGLLARSDEYLTDRRAVDATALRHEVGGRHLVQAKDELMALSAVPLNWAFPNRTRLSNFTRRLATGAKRVAFARFGMGAEQLYPADPNPWGVKLLVEDAADIGREAAAEGRTATVRDQDEGPMREGLNGPVKDKGWFDPRAYSPDDDNSRALVALVREARALGAEVVVMLLPEASTLRSQVPPEAMATLHAALDGAFGGSAPPVLDFRDALTDAQFHDSIHPRKVGRDILTRRLVDALRARNKP